MTGKVARQQAITNLFDAVRGTEQCVSRAFLELLVLEWTEQQVDLCALQRGLAEAAGEFSELSAVPFQRWVESLFAPDQIFEACQQLVDRVTSRASTAPTSTDQLLWRVLHSQHATLVIRVLLEALKDSVEAKKAAVRVLWNCTQEQRIQRQQRSKAQAEQEAALAQAAKELNARAAAELHQARKQAIREEIPEQPEAPAQDPVPPSPSEDWKQAWRKAVPSPAESALCGEAVKQPLAAPGESVLAAVQHRAELTTVQRLLDLNGDVLEMDRSGDSALHIAMLDGRSDLCKLLLQHGANPWSLNHQSQKPCEKAGARVKRARARMAVRPVTLEATKLLVEDIEQCIAIVRQHCEKLLSSRKVVNQN